MNQTDEMLKIRKNIDEFNNIDKKLQEDLNFILEIMKYDFRILGYISKEMQNKVIEKSDEKQQLLIRLFLTVNELKNKTGTITFSLMNENIALETSDIIGSAIQSFLASFFIKKNISIKCNENSQEFPDFIGDHGILLEVKCFRGDNGSAAFDIANFDSYCDRLRDNISIIDAYYLIFEYSMKKEVITIDDIWLKQIWEITGKMEKSRPPFPLTVQRKRNIIYNIRPQGHFKQYDKCFNSKKDFLIALYQSINQYKDSSYTQNWLEIITKNEDYLFLKS